MTQGKSLCLKYIFISSGGCDRLLQLKAGGNNERQVLNEVVCVTFAVALRNGSTHVIEMLLRAVVTYVDKVVGQCQIYQSVFPFSFFKKT